MSIHAGLQRKKTSAAERDDAPRIVRQALRSGGQPLDNATRAFMEPRFGHDFSNVRVHADARAAESAEAVSAHAYTVGQDIVFGEGQYVPGTSEGRRLLAHELTHMVQQAAGPVSGVVVADGLVVSKPGDAFERAADTAANAVLAGGAAPAGAAPAGISGGLAIQREEKNRDPRFQLIPPKLQLPVGPLDLQANTNSAQLGYINDSFNTNLGYNYGGNIYTGIRDGDLSARLGVNPGSGEFSLSGSYDQFHLSASADPSAQTFNFGLSYGRAQAPWLSHLTETMRDGGQGLTSAIMALPNTHDPVSYYQDQQKNIDNVKKAFNMGHDIADPQPSAPTWGIGGGLQYGDWKPLEGYPVGPQIPKELLGSIWFNYLF